MVKSAGWGRVGEVLCTASWQKPACLGLSSIGWHGSRGGPQSVRGALSIWRNGPKMNLMGKKRLIGVTDALGP